MDTWHKKIMHPGTACIDTTPLAMTSRLTEMFAVLFHEPLFTIQLALICQSVSMGQSRTRSLLVSSQKYNLSIRHSIGLTNAISTMRQTRRDIIFKGIWLGWHPEGYQAATKSAEEGMSCETCFCATAMNNLTGSQGRAVLLRCPNEAYCNKLD